MPTASVDSIVTDPPAGIAFMGLEWDRFRHENGDRAGFVAFMTEVFREAARVLKPGGHAVVWALPRTSYWTAWAIDDAGFEVRDVIHHAFASGMPKSLDVSKAIDKSRGRVRRVVGTKAGLPGYSLKQTDAPGGYAMQGNVDHSLRNPAKECEITAPAGADSYEWTGFGTALKPAIEHWILARKPLTGTVIENVLSHGTGAINVDACRVFTGEAIRAPQSDPRKRKGTVGTDLGFTAASVEQFQAAQRASAAKTQSLGRWPANLTHDGSDEVLAVFPHTKSGAMRAGQPRKRSKGKGGYGGGFPDTATLRDTPGDSGSASRMFYCAKTSKKDRSDNGTVDNKHATVKPLALMRYLCRLVTPPGGLVLDPFCGSGSTGKAAVLEGFRFVGIERETEYAQVAMRRLWNAEASYLAEQNGGVDTAR